jgi:DHA1 family tetracycline resistance protein-like MFS transporter
VRRLMSFLPGSPDLRLWIIVVSVFLNFAGFTVIIPVLPFTVEQFVPEDEIATYVSVILSSYALCAFLAAPFLGALSDRFGRRPILLVSLCGSAVGFVIFGIGGAMWVLLLGRVIDGLTAGSISAMYAYIADTNAPKDRGAAYGMLGAASGLGFMSGPALGGLLGQISLSAPLFAAAALAALNVLWIWFALPESHPVEKRSARLDWRHLNPFGALVMAFNAPQLRPLFLVSFFFFVAATIMHANSGVFLKDVLAFDVAAIGAVLFGVGVMDIVSQGIVAPWLMKRFRLDRVTTAGLVVNGIGFLIMASLPLFPSIALIAVGVAVLTLGDGLVQPALNALISTASPPGQQGRVQGANQAQQSIARMVGPLASAWLYTGLVSGPYLASGTIVLIDAVVFLMAIRRAGAMR